MTKEEKKKAKEEAKAKKKAEKLAAKQAKKAAKEAKKQGKTVPAQQKAAEQAPVENKPVAKAEGKPAAPANGKSGNAAPEDGGELSEKAEGSAAGAQQPEPEEKAEEDKKQPADGQGKAKPAVKNYHVARRQDGKWQVKFAKGERAIKLFDTQEEAIAYAKKLAANQDGRITIHKKDGSIRKQKY